MSIESLSEDVREINRLLEEAKRPRVRNLLTVEARRLEDELAAVQAASVSALAQAQQHQSSATANKIYQVKLSSYGWEQNSQYVKIFVTLPGAQTLQPDQVNSEFSPRSVELLVKNMGGKNYSFSVQNLLHDIRVEQATHKIKTDMIVLWLPKSTANIQWTYLTKTEKELSEKKKPAPRRVNDDATSADPSQSVMQLMQQMYEEGDDDMKRLINKAWCESRANNQFQ